VAEKGVIGNIYSPVLNLTMNVVPSVYLDEVAEYFGVVLGHQLLILVNADYITSTVVYASLSILNVIVLGS
jgi:hypothetical protein